CGRGRKPLPICLTRLEISTADLVRGNCRAIAGKFLLDRIPWVQRGRRLMLRVRDVRRGLRFAVATYLAVWAVLAAGLAAPALASELDALYSQVLQNPRDTELNLRFARLAEDSGNLRWALSAYERAVLNDPGNPEARSGL